MFKVIDINNFISIIRSIIFGTVANSEQRNNEETIEQKAEAFTSKKLLDPFKNDTVNFDEIQTHIYSGNLRELHLFAKNLWEKELNDQTVYGYSLLYLAASTNHEQCVRKLLDLKAKHQLESHGTAPIHRAAQLGHDKSLKVFIDRDVPITFTDKSGIYNALHYATRNGHKNCIDILLKASSKAKNPFSMDDLKLAHELTKYIKEKNHQEQCATAIKNHMAKLQRIERGLPVSADHAQPASTPNIVANLNTKKEQKANPVISSKNDLNKHKNQSVENIVPANTKNLPKIELKLVEGSSWFYGVNLENFSKEVQKIIRAVNDLEYKIYISGQSIRDNMLTYIHHKKQLPIIHCELITNMPPKKLRSLLEALKIKDTNAIKIISYDCQLDSIDNNPINEPRIQCLPTAKNPLDILESKAKLTIDICYLDPLSETIYFAEPALLHLQNKEFKPAGPTAKNFEQDPYLIFQAMRFKYLYKVELSTSIAQAINKNLALLQAKDHFNYTRFVHSLENFFEINLAQETNKTNAIIDALKFLIKSGLIKHIALTKENKHCLYGNPTKQEAFDVFEAVAKSNIEQLQILLHKNAELDKYDEKYGTPLTLAIKNNNIKCICFLILAGANIETALKFLRNENSAIIHTPKLAF